MKIGQKAFDDAVQLMWQYDPEGGYSLVECLTAALVRIGVELPDSVNQDEVSNLLGFLPRPPAAQGAAEYTTRHGSKKALPVVEKEFGGRTRYYAGGKESVEGGLGLPWCVIMEAMDAYEFSMEGSSFPPCEISALVAFYAEIRRIENEINRQGATFEVGGEALP